MKKVRAAALVLLAATAFAAPAGSLGSAAATGASGPSLISPLAGAIDVITGFGEPVEVAGESGTHRGIDLRAPAADPVFASAPGVVSYVGRTPGVAAGPVNCVTVDHGGSLTTYRPLDAIAVRPGQSVDSATRLGGLAVAGDPSSPESHLNLTLREGSTYVDPLPQLVARDDPAASGSAEGATATSGAVAQPGPSPAPGAVLPGVGEPAVVGASVIDAGAQPATSPAAGDASYDPSGLTPGSRGVRGSPGRGAAAGSLAAPGGEAPGSHAGMLGSRSPLGVGTPVVAGPGSPGTVRYDRFFAWSLANPAQLVPSQVRPEMSLAALVTASTGVVLALLLSGRSTARRAMRPNYVCAAA